jgi:hypothetical protein
MTMSRRPPPFDYTRSAPLPIYPTRRPTGHDAELAFSPYDAAGYLTPLSLTRTFQPFEYWTPAHYDGEDVGEAPWTVRHTMPVAARLARFIARLVVRLIARFNRWIAGCLRYVGGFRAQG